MKNKILYLAVICLSLGLFSCEALFDNLEGDLSKMTSDDMYGSKGGITRLMANIYNDIPMNAFATGDKNTMNGTDTHGTTYGTGGVSTWWDFVSMRDINTLIEQLDIVKTKGVITEAEYNTYKGEALFIRAYCYFAVVRSVGGFPIVDKTLDSEYDGKENLGLYIPRSTEKDSWDWVLAQLDDAIALLPEANSEGAYRANKYAALALKSRVALYAASVSKYWNNAPIENTYDAVNQKLTYMEPSYADVYYQQCIDASAAIIDSGKYSLYGATPTSVAEATNNYTNLFMSRQSEEWIFGKSYSNGIATNSNGFDAVNSPNQEFEAGTGWQAGRFSITLDLVDVYDCYDAGFNAVDGTIKTRNDNVENVYVSLPKQTFNPSVNYIAYDNPSEPFENKDARFKASIIYPGVSFRNETMVIQGGLVKPDGTYKFYDKDEITIDGVTYYTHGANTVDVRAFSGFYLLDNTNDGNWYSTGFGIRKFLDPNKAQQYAQNPWCDMRYAEILLNYCEAQVELNGTNAGNSKEYLNDIRRRAYFLDQKDATIENVLHERRVEMAFENDYSYTLHRRREFYNSARDEATNPNGGRRHALVPMLDLRGTTPKYLFVRVNHYHDDVDKRASVNNVDNKSYYSGISNWEKNKLVPNPSQQ